MVYTADPATAHQATRCIAVGTAASASESRENTMTTIVMIYTEEAREADTMTMMTTTGVGVESIMMMMMTTDAKEVDIMMMTMIIEERVENTVSMDVGVADMVEMADAREESMTTGEREGR